MTKIPQSGTPYRANCCLYSLFPIPFLPTRSPPFTDGKEGPARHQGEQSQTWPVGLCLFRGKQQGAQMMEGDLKPAPASE